LDHRPRKLAIPAPGEQGSPHKSPEVSRASVHDSHLIRNVKEPHTGLCRPAIGFRLAPCLPSAGNAAAVQGVIQGSFQNGQDAVG
jgi:hypothetical protein